MSSILPDTSTETLRQVLIDHLQNDPIKLDEKYVTWGIRVLTRRELIRDLELNTFMGQRVINDLIILTIDLLERKKLVTLPIKFVE